ncbi:FAD-binding domain-containing protein [Exidia glandulosa HHB12029]|uniref:FAD-binding domain-containing protein n=1 Tax=Exidia glandulosa HHB12029 TaxID=1314781 RepID=A0A165Z8S7_EXIGL|nr:FAD-binding domain-containing protein [Exidia glandulosa HHB12029]
MALPILMDENLSRAIDEIKVICKETESCFDYGTEMYKNCIRHFLASSSEISQIAVQPSNVREVSKILKVIAKYRVPFAIKGGGHGMAPGMSSTTGIHISMGRFVKVEYDTKSEQVTIGAGCLWDRVYSALAATGRNVIGGAANDGVGVGGWLLGGGYSLKSNKYGLGIDNIVAMQVVTPDGNVHYVSNESNDMLFHALRGGNNNFGIVTRFTLRTFPQNPTYGSYFKVPGTREAEFKKALPQYEISIFCVFDAQKPKRKSEEPFIEFKHLQAYGESMKADPAGWQLGATNVPVLEHSQYGLLAKPAKPAKVAEPNVTPGRRRRARDQDNSSDSLPSYARRGRENVRDEDDGSNPDNFCGFFEEMSFKRLHRVAPRQPPSYRSSVLPQEESDDSDASNESADDSGSSDDQYASPDSSSDEDSDDDSSKVSRKRGSPARSPRERRIMISKPIDKMGELSERGRFGCLMISKYNQPLLDKMAEEAKKAASYLKKKNGIAVVIDAWPVHEAIFDNSPPGAAFPHERGKPYGPLLAYFRWQNAADDEFWLTKLKGTLNRIRVVARNLGLTPRKPAYYNNLSLETVPVHKIYRGNMNWLSKVKAQYDPSDVMSLCGGHKIPLPTTKKGGGKGRDKQASESSDESD